MIDFSYRTAEIFDILSKGQFICSNAIDSQRILRLLSRSSGKSAINSKMGTIIIISPAQMKAIKMWRIK